MENDFKLLKKTAATIPERYILGLAYMHLYGEDIEN